MHPVEDERLDDRVQQPDEAVLEPLGHGASPARRPAAAEAAAGLRLTSFERDRPLDMGFDHLFETLLAHRPDDRLDDFSVLEEEEARNRAHRVLLGGALVLVDVDLAD